MNLDGPITKEALNTTIGSAGRDQAVVLWQQESLDDVPVQDTAYAQFKETVARSVYADFFAHVKLKATKHYAFLDGPLLFDIAGLRDDENPQNSIAEFFGTISGKRYMEVMGSYTQTLVEFLMGRKGDLGVDI